MCNLICSVTWFTDRTDMYHVWSAKATQVCFVYGWGFRAGTQWAKHQGWTLDSHVAAAELVPNDIALVCVYLVPLHSPIHIALGSTELFILYDYIALQCSVLVSVSLKAHFLLRQELFTSNVKVILCTITGPWSLNFSCSAYDTLSQQKLKTSTMKSMQLKASHTTRTILRNFTIHMNMIIATHSYKCNTTQRKSIQYLMSCLVDLVVKDQFH